MSVMSNEDLGQRKISEQKAANSKQKEESTMRFASGALRYALCGRRSSVVGPPPLGGDYQGAIHLYRHASPEEIDGEDQQAFGRFDLH